MRIGYIPRGCSTPRGIRLSRPSRPLGESGAVRARSSAPAPPSSHYLTAALRLQSAEPRRFVDLARAMGIPSHDAARQVMEIIETRAMLSPCGSRTNGR